MDIRNLFRKDHNSLNPYIPVLSPESLAKLGGESAGRIIKLNANENPYGPSPRVKEELGKYQEYNIYPDAEQTLLREALSKYVGVSSKYILAGAGADEIIDLILRAILEPGDTVIDCPPTFGMYSFSTYINGGEVISVPRDISFNVNIDSIKNALRDNTKAIFIASPNNPTGNLILKNEVLGLLDLGILVVIDEAYCEFSGHTMVDLISKYQNLIILRTASKWCGLAGLRIGYGIMDPIILQRLMDIKQPYNINSAAEIALIASLGDLEYLKNNVSLIIEGRDKLFQRLLNIEGIYPYPSYGNFILCHLSQCNAKEIYAKLANLGIFVRYFDLPEISSCLRISIGTPEQMDVLIESLSSIISGN